jgi:hypothetical protein
MNSKKRFFLLLITTLNPVLWCLFSCSGLKNILRNWLETNSRDHAVISDYYELPPKSASLQKKHQEILQYLSRQKIGKGQWSLTNLRFVISDSTRDSNGTHLHCEFLSRSRYNLHYRSKTWSRIQEWKNHGLDFLTVWQYALPALTTEGISLYLQVGYKHKNYLRPETKLKSSFFSYRIKASDIQDKPVLEIYHNLLAALKKSDF